MPTTAVTKSSHYVSVQQSSSSGVGSSRYMSWSIRGRQHYCCSLQGILRLLQAALLTIIVFMTRYAAGNGRRLEFGTMDTDMAGVGGSVGCLIIVLILIVCHLFGHLAPTLLEVFVNLVGAVMMLTIGGLCMAYYSNRQYRYYDDRTAGQAMAVLTIIAGVVFLVDLVLSLRHLKINIST